MLVSTARRPVFLQTLSLLHHFLGLYSLSARTYAHTGRLVLEIRDSMCPWNDGRVELEGGPDGAVCRPSTRSPDLVLAASDLAATYMGTVRFRTLREAGRADERTSRGVAIADSMFSTAAPPWSPEIF